MNKCVTGDNSGHALASKSMGSVSSCTKHPLVISIYPHREPVAAWMRHGVVVDKVGVGYC